MTTTNRRSILYRSILPSLLISVGCASSGSSISATPASTGGRVGSVGSSSATGSTVSSDAIGGAGNTESSSSSDGGTTSAATSNGGNASSGVPEGGADRGGATSGETTNGGAGNTAPTNGGASAVKQGGASSVVTGGGRSSATRGGASPGGAKNGGTGGRTSASTVAWGQAGNMNAGSTCGNGTKDDDETDVDCGGACAPLGRCAVGQACVDASDCTTTTCISKACAEPLVVVKNAGCADVTGTCPTAANVMSAKLQVLNVGTGSLALKGLEIRYYYTDDAASLGTSIVEVDDKAPSDVTVTLVAMTTPTATADHYVKITYATSSLVTDANRKCDRTTPPECAEVSFRVHQSNYQGTYDPSNDYSFVPSPSVVNNGLITVHQNGNVIWGTPPE